MRIVILTEDEPFFTAKAFRSFLSILPPDVEPVLAVIVEFSPCGARFSRAANIAYHWRTFGPSAFLYAGLRYLLNSIDRSRRTQNVFRDNGIPALCKVFDINDDTVTEVIRAARPELLISVSMNQLFGSRLLGVAPCLNLHLSLLPRHRGLMPVFWALHDGDQEVGATVHWVNGHVDGGKILVQRRLPVRARRLAPLYGELKHVGMQALAEAIGLGANAKKPAHPGQSTSHRLNHKPGKADVKAFRSAGNHLF